MAELSEHDVKDDIEHHVYEVDPLDADNDDDDADIDDDDFYIGEDDDTDANTTPSRRSTKSDSPTSTTRPSHQLPVDDPSKEACSDIGLFLRKYYLDWTGLPDPAKTPQTLCLRGLSRDQLAALSRIFNDHFIDLYWFICGNTRDRIMCVGWDRQDVRQTADEFDSKRYERRAQAYATYFGMPDSIPEEND